MTGYIDRLFSRPMAEKPYDERLEHARELLHSADAVLIGAGAGLSTAAGLSYGGEDFKREFREWINHYGFTDLYSSSFYPFKTEEEYWAYWAKHIWFSRFRDHGLPLYQDVKRLVEDKDYFVITTNTDGQFLKTGFDKSKIFDCQGDYAYLQSVSGRSQKTYYNKGLINEMIAKTKDFRIPTELIPHEKETGEKLMPYLRVDNHFVENDEWHEKAEHYTDFISKYRYKKLLLLEFGVGFNTPGIIRFPFERMAASFSRTSLVRFNPDPQLMTEGVKDFTAFKEDIKETIAKM